jgi:hypothetical protein
MVLIRGTSPTVREGAQSDETEPSLTVGLVPRFVERLRSPQNYSTTAIARGSVTSRRVLNFLADDDW